MVIPKFMESNVKLLTKLVQDTYSSLPTKGVSADRVLEQMEKFQVIKVGSGK